MRKPLIAVWLVLPLAAWTYHMGPGQDRVKLDQVDAYLAKAKEAIVAQDWDMAIDDYGDALKVLPSERINAGRRIRLALNQARMMHKQLPAAQRALAELVREMAKDPDAEPSVLADARRAHASAQYYVTWLMRLEGYPREQWEPELEVARQTYRLLAERADQHGDKTAGHERRMDLEATIRLARLDLQELQGLPLPNQ